VKEEAVLLCFSKKVDTVTETRLPLPFIAAIDAVIFGFHENKLQKFRQTNGGPA
jgi:hypothetical protein